jgi:transposase
MGWISMSERDLKRIQVLSDVRTGRRTVAAAAAVLAISERQTYRLLAKYELDGGTGLIHKARGQTSNRSTNEGVRKYAVEFVKTQYAAFGPTLAVELLLDKYAIKIKRKTLRIRMIEDGRCLFRRASLK